MGRLEACRNLTVRWGSVVVLLMSAWVAPLPAADKTIAFVPLRDQRQKKDLTPIGTGLARYLARDVGIIRPVKLLPQEEIELAVLRLRTLDRSRVSPTEVGWLCREMDTDEVLWGSFAAYQTRVSIVLEYFDRKQRTSHHLTRSGSRERVFEILDRLVLELAELALWTVTADQKARLVGHNTESFEAYQAACEGEEMYRMGNLEGAEASHLTALKLDPSFTWARHLLTITRVKLDRLAEAESACRDMMKSEPEFWPTHNTLGVILRQRGKKEPAVRAFRHGITCAPDSAILHFNLGNAYMAQERDTEMRNAYETAIKLDPAFAEPHYQLALFYEARGSTQRSRQEAQKARDLKPSLYSSPILGEPRVLPDILIDNQQMAEKGRRVK